MLTRASFLPAMKEWYSRRPAVETFGHRKNLTKIPPRIDDILKKSARRIQTRRPR